MKAPIRFGLLGLGRHGQRYARHLTRQDIPHGRLGAVWTRDRDKCAHLAAQLKVTPTPSMEALVNENVDAIIAAVPAALHLPIAELTAYAQKPLLLEKPIARTVEEGRQICEIFQKHRLPLMIAQTLRYDPLVLALRHRLPELGPLHGFSMEQRLEPRGLPWEDEPDVSGGGVLIQTAIHTLDMLRFVTKADRVSIHAACLERIQTQQSEDFALIQLRIYGHRLLQNGVLGDVGVSKIGRSRHLRSTFYGQNGGLEADFIDRTLEQTEGRNRTKEHHPETPTVVAVVSDFIDVLRGQDNPIPGEDGLRSLEWVFDAYRKAAS